MEITCKQVNADSTCRWTAQSYSSLAEVKAVEFTAAEILVPYNVTGLGYSASVLQRKEALVP